ncbi:MAG: hypothetical protein J3T61_12095, partial [Candidatus Brocadiales bacterium]|nr:hypothetical protein [Candidatus Bathyanammoxibius sp.]
MPLHDSIGDFFQDTFDDSALGGLFGRGGSSGGSASPNDLNLQKLGKFGSLLIGLLDRTTFQQDPVRRALLQNQIESFNLTNATDGNGRFQVGNPLGDNLSGF